MFMLRNVMLWRTRRRVNFHKTKYTAGSAKTLVKVPYLIPRRLHVGMQIFAISLLPGPYSRRFVQQAEVARFGASAADALPGVALADRHFRAV